MRDDDPVSVDEGVPYINLAAFKKGSIVNNFTIVNNTLVWSAEQFSGGKAGFCQTANNTIYATFTGAGGPGGNANCVPVSLVIYEGELPSPLLLLHRF